MQVGTVRVDKFPWALVEYLSLVDWLIRRAHHIELLPRFLLANERKRRRSIASWATRHKCCSYIGHAPITSTATTGVCYGKVWIINMERTRGGRYNKGEETKDTVKTLVVKLLSEGLCFSEISRITGLAKSSCHWIADKYVVDGSSEIPHGRAMFSPKLTQEVLQFIENQKMNKLQCMQKKYMLTVRGEYMYCR